MAKIADAEWNGQSGTKYNFAIYPLGTKFKAVGAVYIFTKRTVKSDGTGSHDFIYIGQTGDLSTRFDNHHKDSCIEKHGANCVCIHLNSNESQRLDIETDLVRHHNPPCNG
jgi:hypothetical protein